MSPIIFNLLANHSSILVFPACFRSFSSKVLANAEESEKQINQSIKISAQGRELA
jgi:hypothetical protein